MKCHSSMTFAFLTLVIFSVLEIKRSRVSSNKKMSLRDGDLENNSMWMQLLKTAGIVLKTGERQNEIGIL